MPVTRKPPQTTKDRPIPVDPDAAIVRVPGTLTLLGEILMELKVIRLTLATAFNLSIGPEDLT